MLKHKLLTILGLLTIPLGLFAAPNYTIERTMLPEVHRTYELGTSTREWLNLFTFNASSTNASTSVLAITGTATTTARNGFNITGGCYAINGTCIGVGSITGSGTQGQLAFWTSTTALGSVATTTANCTGSVSCNQFVVIGGSPITITGSGGTAGSSKWATSSNGTALYPNGGTGMGVVIGGTATTSNTKLEVVGTTTASQFVGNGTATSTFTNGLNLSGGCFAINGVCVGGSTYTASWPITLSGSTFGFDGLATTSPWTIGQLAYVVSGQRVSSVATTTVSCSGSTSCTGFVAIGNSPITISSTGVGTGLATTSPISDSNVLVYSSAGAGSAYGVATGTVSAGTGISLDNNTRSVIGGALQITNSSPLSALVANYPFSFSNPTLTWLGLGTTSPWTVGQVTYVTNGNTIASVATGTVSSSGGITTTSGRSVLGGALSIACDVASSLIPGCLSAADWTTFNNKQNSLGSGTAGQILAWLSGTPTWTATTTFSGGLTYSNGNVTNTLTAGDGLTRTVDDIDCDTASGTTFGCLSSTDWSTFNNKQNTISVNWPITLSGATIGFNGLATTSPWTTSNLAYVVNGNTVSSVATTTVSCSGATSCTQFTAIGGSPITISSTAGASAYEIATTSDIAVPQVAYFTKTGGLTTLGSVATGTISSANSALTVTSNRYTLGGATTFTIATTSNNMFSGTAGQVLAYLNGGWTGVATTTFSGGLTYANGNVTNTLTAGDGLTRTVDDIDCDTANGTTFGCLTSTDWSTFNGKLSSYDAWTHPIFGTSATTSRMQFADYVEIGTSTPISMLTVHNTGGVASTSIISANNTDAEIDLYERNPSTLQLFGFNIRHSGGNDRLDINASNNGVELNALSILRGASTGQFVGIGSTTPGAKLGVAGSILADDRITTSYFVATSTTATSTFANGINLSNGCFAINNTCVGGSNLTGAGLANRATFWTSSTNISYDNDFTWDNTNKRLGLGVTSPNAILNVNGVGVFNATNTYPTSGGNALEIGYYAAGNYGTVISYNRTANDYRPIQIQAATTSLFSRAVEALTANSSGANALVGVGSTTPGTLLSVGNTNGINFRTSTSSFSSTGGIDLVDGCFAIDSSCIGMPGGSNGAVQFNNSGSFGGDETKFFWNNTAKRLGVGTSSPGITLDTKGWSRVLSSNDIPSWGGDGLEMAYFTAGNYGFIGSLNRDTGQYKKLVIAGATTTILSEANTVVTVADGNINDDGLGFVGIGTTTASRKLGVYGSIYASSTANYSTSTFQGQSIDLITGAGRVGCFAINGTCLGTGNITGTGFAGMLAGWDSATNIVATSTPTARAYIASSTTATSTFAGGLTVDGTTLMVDYANNRVGIRTSPRSPYELDITGDVNLTSSGPTSGLYMSDYLAIQNGPGVYFYSHTNSNTTPGYSWDSDTTTGMYQPTSANIGFTTSGTERVRINSSGLGIGTTTPAQKLGIVGAIYASSTATSTFQGGGINLITGAGNLGCFAINGVCLGVGGGTVTSVDVSGGTTGLTTSGGPITTSGTITLGGTLGRSNGGTGMTTYQTGGILFADASKLIADATNFFWDDTNDFLGLGTNAPTARLDIRGAATATPPIVVWPSGTAGTATTTNSLWLDDMTRQMTGYFGGLRKRIPGVIFTNSTSTATQNTASEVSLIPPAISLTDGTTTIPHIVNPGQHITIYFFEKLTANPAASGGSVSRTYRVKLNSTTTCTATVAHTSGATNKFAEFSVTLNFFYNNKVWCTGHGVGTAITGTTIPNVDMSTASETSFTQPANGFNIDITGQWSNANSNNQATTSSVRIKFE